jgi:hypothetical protein
MQKSGAGIDPTPQDIAWSGGQEPSCAELTVLWLTKAKLAPTGLAPEKVGAGYFSPVHAREGHRFLGLVFL